jgi:hypothetical protein
MKNGSFEIFDYQKNVIRHCEYRNDKIVGEIEEFDIDSGELVF